MATEDNEIQRRRIQHLEKQLSDARLKIAELERARNAPGDELAVPISEFEETLRRLVQRTAMIVQAEKCVIMVRDRESGALVARSPAFGMADEDVDRFRVQDDTGISGDVYQSGSPSIFHASAPQASSDSADLLQSLGIRNGVTVPLLIEKRDEQNHLVNRVTIGVLHCFNKRYGGDFIQEDVTLLERLSLNAAAVIANAQMFQDLVAEKQKLVHTLESLTAGLILVNQHGRIGQINAQARAMFGVSEDEQPVGKPLEEVIQHEECRTVIRRKIEEALNEIHEIELDSAGRKVLDEITIVDEDDQEYIYQIHAAYVHDDNNALIGTVFIFNDITDIRNVERMKTEFVSIVSHELRTPLTPMKGFVRTLLDDQNEEWYTRDDRREFYTIIEDNVDRLGRLINDLLNVSRIEKMGAAGIEMNWEIVDIEKATEEVVAIQRARTDKHTLVIDFEPHPFSAETDPDMIQNILQNLVSNAIKYSPEGGEVRIIGRMEPATEEYPEGAVLMGVKDYGAGIPEAMLPKLGTKFFRVDNSAHRKVHGTGIGLFLVKSLIAAHKGYMWVESELGKGSTFWFRFPARQPKAPAVEENVVNV